ncbi:hypothetical protein AJ79_02180 [Helicocarpus griseus UAMH5409]|uniref:MICOS complex subunit MIC12 n=1 Tax=Helicocarpus griseus UAMH5409 TaxID=1447875 RepID=A0A2B7Y3S4_9EURO|nr:hypothetical protein AJ79_02180 [Helicocarpus griseus UAMH5409]
MGFLAGFLTGISLTTTTAYLTVHLLHSARAHQHALLREQIDTINSIALPATTTRLTRRSTDDAAVAAVLARQGYYPRRERPELMDLVRERWNREVEGAVRRAMEGGLAGFLEGAEGVVKDGLEDVRRGVEGVREWVESRG